MSGKGKNANAWKGGVRISGEGVMIYAPDHPKARGGRYMPEHRLVAEKALGKLLPEKAVVHHNDKNKHNNDPSNLVICESQAYHLYIHMRLRAVQACGDPNWRMCRICKKYDSIDNLYYKTYPNGNIKICRHSACHTVAEAKRKAINRKKGA